MRVGVAFPTTEIGTDPAAVRDFAQGVEELGYDHITGIDHVIQAAPSGDTSWKGNYDRDKMFHEPFVLFGFLAAVTQRIELATAILILPQRPTVLVAKQAAEIDILTQGRLRLGIGLGWNAIEYTALGQNFHDRGRRVEEQLDVMRKLWTEELITYEGEWHRIENAGINPLPVQRPIPIWFGAFAPAAIKRAGRLGDGWFTNPFHRAGDDAGKDIAILREAAEAAGRDPASIGIDGTLAIGDRGPDEWAAEAREWQSMGVSHVTVRTMRADLPGPDAHLDALRRFREVWPAGT
jgi:probable F420-dependent oxidoreductase